MNITSLNWFDVRDYGAVADAVQFSDPTMTSGSPNLSSASNPFVPGCVGKSVIVKGAGTSGSNLLSTVLTYTDANHVVLANNAATSVSPLSSNFACYGTPNQTAFKDAADDAGSYVEGGIVYIPSGSFLLTDTVDLSTGYLVAGTIPYIKIQGANSTNVFGDPGNKPLFSLTNYQDVSGLVAYNEHLDPTGIEKAYSVIKITGGYANRILDNYLLFGFASVEVTGNSGAVLIGNNIIEGGAGAAIYIHDNNPTDMSNPVGFVHLTHNEIFAPGDANSGRASYAILLQDASGVIVENNTSLSNSTLNLNSDSAVIRLEAVSVDMEKIIVRGNIAKQTNSSDMIGAGISLTATSSHVYSDLQIVGNILDGFNIGVDLGSGWGANAIVGSEFSGNKISNSRLYGVRMIGSGGGVSLDLMAYANQIRNSGSADVESSLVALPSFSTGL